MRWKRADQQATHDRRIAEARSRLGNRCADCGSDERYLEFDHVHPSTRVAPITTLATASRSRFDAEVAKCQLLCRACHRRKTNREIGCPENGPQHGSTSRYGYGCRCDQCRQAKTAAARAWRENERQLRLEEQRVWLENNEVVLPPKPIRPHEARKAGLQRKRHLTFKDMLPPPRA